MTRLLVSVADAQEAIDAVENGADLIDVKDPLAGSLGAATAQVQKSVLKAVNDRVPVSAALGELLDPREGLRSELPPGLAFAKVGLSHCRSTSDWLLLWRTWQHSLPADTQPVAVCYVDWQSCGSPSPGEIIQQIIAPGFSRVLLFDTFLKGGQTLLDHCPLPVLRDLCESLRSLQCQVVLAGSLSLTHLPDLLPLAPDYIAVRGAVCRGDRTATLDGALVRAWATALNQQG